MLAVTPLSLADESFYGLAGFGESRRATMSSDGQLVVFQSATDNLVPNDTNGKTDVFVFNRGTNRVSLVSVALDGSAAGTNNPVCAPVISPDGRFVAFESSGTPILTGINPNSQLYLRNLTTNVTTLLTPNAAGTGGANVGLHAIDFTADSQNVLWQSSANFDTNPTQNLTNDTLAPFVQNIFKRSVTGGPTTLVSADTGGVGAGIRVLFDGPNFSTSFDGRYVAFLSSATTHVTGDNNGETDSFVRDTVAGSTVAVSLNRFGLFGPEDSGGAIPSLSADGRYAAFLSSSPDITTVNPNGGQLAYVRDLIDGVSTAVSVRPDQTVPAFSFAFEPKISADGRTVIFTESHSLLAQTPTTASRDVYAFDMVSRTLSLVSVNAEGTAGGNADSGGNLFNQFDPIAITPNGRYVFFHSTATNLVEGATVANLNLYRRDLLTGVTELVSAAPGGAAGGNGDSDIPVFSDDGRYVAFESKASNLAVGDANSKQDIFLRDMALGATSIASRRSFLLPSEVFPELRSEMSSIASDGSRMAFVSQDLFHFAPTLNANPFFDHPLVRDLETGEVLIGDVTPDGLFAPQGNLAVLSASGQHLAFRAAANLDASHPNPSSTTQVFVRNLQTNTTTLVSLGPGNVLGNQQPNEIAISASGRFVAWKSSATNLVAGFVNNTPAFEENIFVWDRNDSSVRLVSHVAGNAAASGDGDSRRIVFSPDESKLAFNSESANLLTGTVADTNNRRDLFVYNLATGAVSAVSVVPTNDATGDEESGDLSLPSNRYVFSANGQFLYFASRADNLVGALDSNNNLDVFRRDLNANTTTLLSVNATNTGSGNSDSFRPSISSDGQKVAFESFATNLVAGFGNANTTDGDIFVRDLGTNTTTLLSGALESPTTAGNKSSASPVISPDGRYVSFTSFSTDLITGFVEANGNGGSDLFIRDLQTNKSVLVTANQAGTAGGRENFVFNQTDVRLFSTDNTLFFNSTMPDLVPGDRNGAGDVFMFVPAGASEIRGRVFEDQDSGGTQNGLEGGLRDWVVYMDANDNGVLDSGERRKQTDSGGNYAFNNLAPGTYVVRAEPQTDFLPTTPESLNVVISSDGQVQADQNFGEQVQAPDLEVTVVNAPNTGRIGDAINISWTVQNNGTDAAGDWVDAVYVSPSPELTEQSVLLATVERTGGLAAGAQYNGNVSAQVPATIPGGYFIIVEADRRGQVAFEADRANNVLAKAGVIILDVPVLTPGVDFTGDAFSAGVREFYYRINLPTSSGSLALSLDSLAASGGTSLYLKRNTLPTPFNFDLRANVFNLPDQSLVNPTTPAGTYFVLARSELGAAANAAITVRADLPVGLQLTAIDRNSGGNTGEVTIAIDGFNISRTTAVQLMQGATPIAGASKIEFQSAAKIFATFDLEGLTPGNFGLRLTDGITPTPALPFDIVPGASPEDALEFDFELPAAARHHGQIYTAVLEYTNTGNTDLAAPILVINTTHARLMLPSDVALRGDFDAASVQFLAISPEGPAGVLRSGQTGKQAFYFQPGPDNEGDFDVSFGVSVIDAAAFIDWVALKDDIRPSFIQADAWDAIFPNLHAELGDTTDEYNARQAQAASYLSSIGQPSNNGAQIWSFLLSQADAMYSPRPVLAAALDAGIASPGLELSLARAYRGSISSRYRQGMFGRGWASPWEISLTEDSNRNVLITMGNTVRGFSFGQERALNLPFDSYRGSPGELGDLRKFRTFELTEPTGEKYVFRTDGKLDFMQDTHGNRITAGYNVAGKLTSLTHSSGVALTLAYNGNGLVSQVQDTAGRTVTYFYETDGQHLTRVVSPQGETRYEYVTGQGAQREHALAQVTHIDGTHEVFAYDARGRLTETGRLNVAETQAAEAITYAYLGDGLVTATDEQNHVTSIWFNVAAQVEQVQNALGHISTFQHDFRFDLVAAIDPLGNKTSLTYDSFGNLASILNPLGQLTKLIHGGRNQELTHVLDANGNRTLYRYDFFGNLLSIKYAGGGEEKFEYDPLGNLTETLNRRGNATEYRHDARGRLTRLDFADGSFQRFTYDSFDNLIKADTATGLADDITLSYANPADGRLTRIDYPGGKFLEFTYDSFGQRTQSLDQNGFTVKYSYDSHGRLAELKDAADARIVLYTYDNDTGLLLRKDHGNGTFATFTTYAYDALGQLTNIDNFQPGGAVKNSFFVYTYDAAGRVLTSTSADGLTTYSYDAAGQLLRVDLPGLPAGRTIIYSYDAVGNRTRVIDSLLGVFTYTFGVENELTQMTDPVSNTSFTYDADMNLSTRTDAGGTTNFTFDDLNQLTGISGSAGTFSYEINPLGQRVAATTAGQTTTYLVDPTGLGNVVGEYGPGGPLDVTNYVHGIGLESRVGPGGTGFYDFDITGNTIGISGAAGTYVNRYSYLPFGETTNVVAPALSNAFTFVGQFGVMQADAGLSYMRARSYAPTLAHFASNDPLRLLGGDVNLRRYVANSPILFVDPSGLADVGSLTKVLPSQKDFTKAFNEVAPKDVKDHNKLLKDAQSVLDAAKDPLGFLTGKLQSKVNEIIGKSTGVSLIRGIDDSVGAKAAALAIQELIRLVDEFERDHPGEMNGQPRLTALERQQLNDLVKTLSSIDPNLLTGPSGFGPGRFTRPEGVWPYSIEYENAPEATAAAQEVVVTHQVDADLDYGTFELVSFGFGPVAITVPEGLQQFQGTVPFQNLDGTPLNVKVNLDFNQQTGLFTASFLSADPESGQLSLDAFAGFLPPDDFTNRGKGIIQYLIRPKASLATGVAVDQVARIFFDGNAPIDTPVFTNTIDVDPPTSSVTALPAVQNTASFTVNWSGADGVGSGIGTFDVFVSQDNGVFTLFKDDTADINGTFTGVFGSTYRFYSVATDNVGLEEQKAPTAEATTTLQNPVGNVTVDDEQVGAKATDLQLKITGDNLENKVKIELGADGIKNKVRVSGLGGTTINGGAAAVEFVGITKGILATLLGGDDVFEVSGRNVKGPISLDAGLGDDTFIINSSKTKFVLLDAGGTDTFDFSAQTKAAKVDLAKSTGRSQGLGNGNSAKLTGDIERVLGSAFNDNFKGNALDNLLVGNGGKDKLDGRAGNDILLGGEGRDTLTGGLGNDILLGGAENDTLKATEGFDLLIGGLGLDTLTGGKLGNSLLIGGTTTHDIDSANDNDVALRAILAEWSSAASLADRKAHLTAGVGVPLVKLTLTAPATVIDDALDKFKTKGGNNWLFKLGADKHTGFKTGDEVTTL